MRRTITAVITGWTLLSGSAANAQGGIRFIIWNFEPVIVGERVSHYGLGYDHDLNDRLSLGVDLRYSAGSESVVMNYRSAFHFSSNDRTSFYMGPTVGLRSFWDDGIGPQVPVGFRIGLRGSLEQFYADIFMGAHYNAGASGKVVRRGYGPEDLHAGSFSVGLALGWGWAGKRTW